MTTVYPVFYLSCDRCNLLSTMRRAAHHLRENESISIYEDEDKDEDEDALDRVLLRYF